MGHGVHQAADNDFLRILLCDEASRLRGDNIPLTALGDAPPQRLDELVRREAIAQIPRLSVDSDIGYAPGWGCRRHEAGADHGSDDRHVEERLAVYYLWGD